MNQAVEVCVEAEVEFGAVGKEEITGEAPAGVKEEEEDSEVKEEVKEEKLCVDSPSPFARGPPSSEGSTEGWGWKTRSLSDGKIPSITDSDLHEDAAVLALRSRGLDDSSAPVKDLQWSISKASGELAIFLKSHEDNGAVLKGERAVKARKELESQLMVARDAIKSKRLKSKASSDLRSVFKDGKAVFQEGILRLSLYEASLATQRSVYCAHVAQDDPSRLRARERLANCITQLSSLIQRAPRRFNAARRDHLHAKAALKMLDALWHRDLKQRATVRPHWVPNSSAAKCAACHSAFSLLRSRHHCRACGMVFCETCSSRNLPLPALAYFTAQRVCEMCYKDHVVHALGRNGSNIGVDWTIIASDIVKALPGARSILFSK